MDKYAIYKYHFKDTLIEKYIFQSEESVNSNDSEEFRRQWLGKLFGDSNASFQFKRQNKNDADDFPCTVMAHHGGIILLRLEKPKKLTQYEKLPPKPGQAPIIKERTIPSNPYIYILIDCRQNSSWIIAISIDSSLWRSTDKVAELLQDNVNSKLTSLSCGFNIEIRPVVATFDFVSHSRRLIKKDKLSVTKMTFYFTRGLINPKVDEIVKRDRFVKGLISRMFNAQHAEYTMYAPESKKIINRNSKIFEHMVMLVGSDPQSEMFRLRMSYSDGRTYSCGKDIRMEFQMNEAAFMSLFGVLSLFPETEMGAWFDNVEEKIKAETDENNTH